MPTIDEFHDIMLVSPGTRLKLDARDPAWAGNERISKKDRKKYAELVLEQSVASLASAQELLWAADTWSVLVVLQAMDAAGKDGTIKHVMSGVNPQGCRVYSFKKPSAEELDHHFLWRYAKVVPERGMIGIFNRSYYEDVLVVRVHPELIHAQKLPHGKIGPQFWADRYEDINNFEKHLTRNGTLILKFFLHISQEEQRQRFLDRVNDPEKHWKLSPADLAERKFWGDYMTAYEDAISATSTEWAPWHIIPADRKWVSRALVASILARSIQGLGLKYPEVTPEQQKAIKVARKELEKE